MLQHRYYTKVECLSQPKVLIENHTIYVYVLLYNIQLHCIATAVLLVEGYLIAKTFNLAGSYVALSCHWIASPVSQQTSLMEDCKSYCMPAWHVLPEEIFNHCIHNCKVYRFQFMPFPGCISSLEVAKLVWKQRWLIKSHKSMEGNHYCSLYVTQIVGLNSL